MNFLILNIERINKTNAAVIIDGPDAVLNSSDEYKPKTTAKSPPIIEIIIICFGLLAKFLAIAAGIISIPVINNIPTILIDIAIIATSDTKLLETTVTGCPSKARAPVVNVTAKPVVTMGITTHRGSRKYAQSDTAISSTIAAAKIKPGSGSEGANSMVLAFINSLPQSF